MREDNNRNIEDINFITDHIWESIILVRGILPVEDYHVYLFLLSAYYDGVTENIPLDFSNNIYDSLFSYLEKKQNYSEILDIYKPIVKSIPEVSLIHIFRRFNMLNIDVLDKHFDEIFDNFLFKLADAQGKSSGIFLLPNEISKFVMEIAKAPNQASVFNPFAGLGSFATHLKNGERYYGQEIVASTWALGMLRLMRQHKHVKIDYRIEDSLQNWPEHETFDLVVSSPPFNFKIFHNGRTIDFGEKSEVATQAVKRDQVFTAEQYVIQKGIQSINPDGKVVCVASMGILFRGGREAGLREYLIQEGLIDTVISLPGGLLRNTGIPICVIILTKKRNPKNVIRMIDGSDFILNFGKRDKLLDLENILDAINSDNKKFVKYISIPEIIENNYNLNIGRYFIDEPEGISLNKILRQVKSKRINEKLSGKFIRTGNLKDNEVAYTLDINEVEDRELSRNLKKIESSCILVSTRWKTLKPTLFLYTGVPIYIGVDILALDIENTSMEIDQHYLISELRSSSILNQFSAYQNIGAVHSLKRSDFFNLKIKVPSIGEQRAKVKGILELSHKFKVLQNERNALAHGQQVKSFDEFASLKHSLGAPRQNILSNAKSLIRFFESNDSSGFDEVKKQYAERYKTGLINDLIQIKEDINHISAILEKGEKGLVLENYELTPIAVKHIQKTLRGLKSSREKFTLHFEQASKDEIMGKAILANITLFQIIIDNIISNAEKYGFKNIDKLNLLVIELKVTEEVMILEIKNNGLPFPNNYNKEKFIAKFSTANPENGTGLGGYDINRIAEYFGNSDWELDLGDSSPFPVSFKFNFPIIPMINE